MRTSRWFGPARVLASETGQPGDRKPSAHVWVIASGRLKKAHVSPLRHASVTEADRRVLGRCGFSGDPDQLDGNDESGYV